jgi:hypothetical protein
MQSLILSAVTAFNRFCLMTIFYQEGIILKKVQALPAGFQPGAEITEYIPIPDNQVPAMVKSFQLVFMDLIEIDIQHHGQRLCSIP